MTNYLKMKTNDNCIIIIEKNIADMSLLFKKMCEDIIDDSSLDIGCLDDDNIPKMPISRDVFCKIIEFMEYHYKIPMEQIQKPLISNDFYKCGISKWDVEYIDVNNDVLFNLASASEFLNIQDLTELICAKIASMLKDKNIEEIQRSLKIDDDNFEKLKTNDNWFKHEEQEQDEQDED
jgi:S-phase kinase-associated protein 1